MPNASDDPSGHVLDCVGTSRRIAAFVERTLDSHEAQALRRHLATCAGCALSYRQTLAAAARMGRSLRRERLADERTRRHNELKRLSRSSGARGPRSRSFLKLFLVSCGLFFLLNRVGALLGPSDLYARTLAGEVRAEGDLLALEEERTLERGDWCLTGPDAEVRLVRRQTQLTLGADGALLVEEPSDVRVRLQRGRLQIDGEALVATALGIATVDGEAWLERDGARVVVRCLRGRVEFLGPVGLRKLTAGQSFEISNEDLC